ncbi:hypothetical protein Glove_42g41 [Diversispora epigaea]|uniref:Uncharacterized protein n=1 Tax=Diversispora epigaea TaxID=1348612 RepID=A0A397JF36_9GLOM|nr:hypothetical protein Glove_42g41 [Diversispora epigaea]
MGKDMFEEILKKNMIQNILLQILNQEEWFKLEKGKYKNLVDSISAAVIANKEVSTKY